MSGSYSSPPCYASEIAPDYFGVVPMMARDELLALLDRLLEAERAGAEVLAEFLNDYEQGSAAWKQLAAVQRDAAKHCAILMDLIKRLDGNGSSATGDFLDKALAVQGQRARLEFLNRGQHWVARKIHEALPTIEQDFVKRALAEMEDSHLLNIEACDALIEIL